MDRTELDDTDICRLMDISLNVCLALYPLNPVLMLVQLLSRPTAPSPSLPARRAVSKADDEAERRLRTELSEREASVLPPKMAAPD